MFLLWWRNRITVQIPIIEELLEVRAFWTFFFLRLCPPHPLLTLRFTFTQPSSTLRSVGAVVCNSDIIMSHENMFRVSMWRCCRIELLLMEQIWTISLWISFSKMFKIKRLVALSFITCRAMAGRFSLPALFTSFFSPDDLGIGHARESLFPLTSTYISSTIQALFVHTEY